MSIRETLPWLSGVLPNLGDLSWFLYGFSMLVLLSALASAYIDNDKVLGREMIIVMAVYTIVQWLLQDWMIGFYLVVLLIIVGYALVKLLVWLIGD